LHDSILNVPDEHDAILDAAKRCWGMEQCAPCFHFGRGNSVELFMRHISRQDIWQRPRQKHFQDIRRQ